mgnify:CR=1 FL=1
MQTTNEFLDAVKQRHGVTSDYALAKLLGVRHTTISNYRTMRSRLDDQMAIKVAKLLEMPPEAVMVAAHGERAKLPEERELWERLWQRVAAVLILGVGITGAPAPAEASTAQKFDNNQSGIQIMRNNTSRVVGQIYCSAPASLSNSTICACPPSVAHFSAVAPSEVFISVYASALSSSFTVPR